MALIKLKPTTPGQRGVQRVRLRRRGHRHRGGDEREALVHQPIAVVVEPVAHLHGPGVHRRAAVVAVGIGSRAGGVAVVVLVEVVVAEAVCVGAVVPDLGRARVDAALLKRNDALGKFGSKEFTKTPSDPIGSEERHMRDDTWLGLSACCIESAYELSLSRTFFAQ